jgi:hypothetical protein
MIVVHVEYRYAAAAEDAMRSLVPDVERFSRGFDGCQSFALSFPVGRSGILLGTEVWARRGVVARTRRCRARCRRA